MEMKNVLMASTAAVALFAAPIANAGDYFTVFGGASFQADVDGNFSTSGSSSYLTSAFGFGQMYTSTFAYANFSVEHEAGFVLGGAYGRNLSPSWRAELEFAYRENQVENTGQVVSGTYGKYSSGSFVFTVIHLPGSTLVPLKTTFAAGGTSTFSGTNLPVDGSTSFFSIMANVWWDFNIVGNWETFVGVGIGYAQANVNDLRLASGYGISSQIVDGSDWVFAYQFGVGAGYTLDNGVRLSAQYRYFGTDEAEIQGAHLEGESSEFLFGVSFPLGN